MDQVAQGRADMIRTYLNFARVSQSDIARQAGVTRGLVCHVIAGRRRNHKVRTAVAGAINIPVEKLWSE